MFRLVSDTRRRFEIDVRVRQHNPGDASRDARQGGCQRLASRTHRRAHARLRRPAVTSYLCSLSLSLLSPTRAIALAVSLSLTRPGRRSADARASTTLGGRTAINYHRDHTRIGLLQYYGPPAPGSRHAPAHKGRELPCSLLTPSDRRSRKIRYSRHFVRGHPVGVVRAARPNVSVSWYSHSVRSDPTPLP